ncbi:MAG: NAD-dependent epimerase/dehydratase family protein [Shimia sp.]
MPQTILLTGITGFIAKRIAHDLIAKGYHVRGSLRSMSRADEVRAVVPDPSKLSFVELDLTSDEGWADAMEGVDAVFHTASPFPLENPKHEDEIVKPAVDGTLRALRAAHAAGISRVVLTSSMVAVMFVDRPEGHRYTARDWTDPDHRIVAAYSKSKTLAERAAWDFAQANPEMQLTTVNPGLVLGTPMDPHTGTSLSLVERLMAGKDPMLPDVGFPVIDIEDISALHIAALEKPETVGHRLLGTDGWWTFPQIGELLAEHYPDRKIPTKIAPKWLLKILALFDGSLNVVLPQIGFTALADTTKTQELTGLTFIPARDAILKSASYVAAHK